MRYRWMRTIRLTAGKRAALDFLPILAEIYKVEVRSNCSKKRKAGWLRRDSRRDGADSASERRCAQEGIIQCRHRRSRRGKQIPPLLTSRRSPSPPSLRPTALLQRSSITISISLRTEESNGPLLRTEHRISVGKDECLERQWERL